MKTNWRFGRIEAKKSCFSEISWPLQESLAISEESLKIFGDQNLKLERRNQDLQDSKMCKTCYDNKVFENRNEVQSDLERENDRLQVCKHTSSFNKWTKISSLKITIFDLKMMVKRGYKDKNIFNPKWIIFFSKRNRDF